MEYPEERLSNILQDQGMDPEKSGTRVPSSFVRRIPEAGFPTEGIGNPHPPYSLGLSNS